jgi:ribosomal protein S18 acetylase RimI-like enzyme
MSKYFRMKLAQAREPEISPSGFKIVSYSPALHHDKIPYVYSDSFQKEPWDEEWDTFIGFDPEGVFIAVDAGTGKYIGFTISYCKGDYCYISIVAVIPEWRRKGVASSLIKTVIKRLRSMKKEMVRVDVEERNTPAVNLYKKAGFVVEETFEE